MNDLDFGLAVQCAEQYADLDEYLRCMTADHGFPEDENVVRWLTQIHAAVNRSVKDIAKAAGMAQYKLAKYFCVPRRTMEDWCRGISRCPTYTRLMMQEALGLVQRS